MLKAILDRHPWHAEQPVVVVAPMFHAWGFSQLRVRRVDGVHDRHPPQVRPGGHPGPRRPAPGHRTVRRPGDVRPHHGPARRGPRPLQRPLAALRGRVGVADAPRRRHRVHGPVRRRHLQQLQRHRGRHDRHRDTGATCAPHPTPRASRPRAPRSASSTPSSTRCPPARSAASTSATPPSSTATPQGTPRTSTTASCRRATSATSTTPAGCSWWAATTR